MERSTISAFDMADHSIYLDKEKWIDNKDTALEWIE